MEKQSYTPLMNEFSKSLMAILGAIPSEDKADALKEVAAYVLAISAWRSGMATGELARLASIRAGEMLPHLMKKLGASPSVVS